MWYKFAKTKEELVNNGQLISSVVILKKEDDKYFVLLNERTKDKWELPGGKVEPGESSLEAAIREIKEETNIKIKPKKLITINESMKEYNNNKKCNYYAYFIGKNDKVQVGSDARKLEWFDIDNLPYTMWNTKDIISHAFSNNLKPIDKNKFVFVDIDGVLNRITVHHKEHKQKYYDNVYNLKEIIFKDKIKLLNVLFDEFNPTFILSSHWRKYGSIFVFNKLFKELGFKGQFLCSTPYEGTEHDDRWKQINYVLKKYKPKNYVILDDKHISLEKNYKNKNWVHVEEGKGLIPEDIEKAIGILKGE